MSYGAARSAAIHRHYYEGLTTEERADPVWDPDNKDQWTAFFTNHHNHELAQYEGNGPPPANRRKLWWGVPGRTLAFASACIT
jgi:hypothetical protein